MLMKEKGLIEAKLKSPTIDGVRLGVYFCFSRGDLSVARNL
jgi:hypothetical protein